MPKFIRGSVKVSQMIYILRYFLAKINKIFAGIVIHISKKSYNLQRKRAKIRLFEKSSQSLAIVTVFFLLSGFSSNQAITAIAPASGLDNKSLSELKNIKGLKLTIDTKCFDGSKSPFHSNSDERRFQCLKEALFDESNIVWALRGGYGSAKLIRYLQKLPIPSRKKIFIGYSDITALHLFLAQKWGWKPIHGANISELLKPEKDPKNFTKLAEILSGKVNQITMDGLKILNPQIKSEKVIHGTLTGGNLIMIQTSIGTNWQIQTADKILFLEDVNIKPYQLDRTLLHLQQAGLLKDIKAIIFGDFDDNSQEIIKVLNNFASTLNIPVYKTNRFGHGKINDPIIYNTESQIRSNDKGDFKLVMRF